MASEDFSKLSHWLAEYEDVLQRSIMEQRRLFERLSIVSEELGHRESRLQAELARAYQGLYQGLPVLEEKLREQIERTEVMYGRLEERLKHVDEMSQTVPSLEVSLDKLASFQKTAETDLHCYLAVQSFGLDLASVPLPRFIPIRVYLSEASRDVIDAVVRAVEGMSYAFGFVVSEEFPAEKGSWWKKWFVKTKEALTQPEVQQRLDKLERALELTGLMQPQANVDKIEAEAAATLIKAVEDVPNVAIQTGSLLLVKTTRKRGGKCVQVRTLTQREMIHLERHQDMLSSPATILERLTEANGVDQLPPPGTALT
jgi:hypothetical protein